MHDLHDVNGQPELGAASPLTTHDLASVTAHLGARHLTFHPETVIASSSAAVVWWERARERPLFFAGQDERLRTLNGQSFPPPPLLLVARPRSLSVFALAENARPAPDTRVCRSPYDNVYADGRVCVGR